MKLLQEISGTEVKPNAMTCWYLGGAGFVFKTKDKLIMIDPYLDTMPEGSEVNRRPPIPFQAKEITNLDILISSHEHEDHCDQVTVSAVKDNTDAIFVGPSTSSRLAKQWGFPENRIYSVKAGNQTKYDNVTINTLECFDPACPEGNIYLIELEKLKIIFCGDSFGHKRFTEYGQDYDIDIAFVSTAVNPKGRNWYMSPDAACKAVKQLNPKLFIPMHWNIWKEAYLSPYDIQQAAVKNGISDRTLVLGYSDRFTYSNEG